MSDNRLPVPSPGRELVRAETRLRLLGELLPARTDAFIEFCCRFPGLFVSQVSSRYALPEALIERYEDRWNWYWLSGNESLPWSEELVARYEDRWDWDELSTKEGLPWSEALIARFEDRWKWSWVTSNDMVWEKVFAPKLNDGLVDSIMARIQDARRQKLPANPGG